MQYSILRFRSIITSVMLLTTLVCFGCKRAETTEIVTPEAQPTSFRQTSPDAYLRAVLTRYQSAASYHDRGLVRLRYQDNGQPTDQVAPIQVWLDHDQLYVAAYDARIWRNDRALTCWIMDPATGDFDSQVVRKPATPTRPTLQQLLEDPIFSEHMSAGLAGPPPQLEWLFAPEPMQPLFDGTHQFRFDSPGTIDGVSCDRVVVDDSYVFWIDSQNSTIRRMEFPPIQAPAVPGGPIQSMTLSVELVGATFRADPAALKLSPLPPNPKYVRRFVPLPPPAPPEVLGTRAPAFRLPTRARTWVVTEQGSDRELTLLVAFGGDAESIYTAGTISQWQSQMPDDIRKRIRIALLIDPRAIDRVPTGNAVSLIVDEDLEVSKALQIASGGLAILDGRGVVSWTQPSWTSTGGQPLITLGAVIADLLSGVDVPTRIRKQWQEQRAEYEAALK